MNEIQIICTDDGSHSLYVPALDETYHSTHGAIQESNHVYIKMALNYHQPSDELHIFEVGFGTGLNLLLTLNNFLTNNIAKKIVYHTIEKFPLNTEIISQINYPSAIDNSLKQIFEQLHNAPWNREFELVPNFLVTKFHQDIRLFSFAEKYNIVYFDAFAPDKQPDIWDQDVFEALYNAMFTNAVLTTYCCKGAVRRTMKAAGFNVYRIEGAPGKREMVRAIKP